MVCQPQTIYTTFNAARPHNTCRAVARNLFRGCFLPSLLFLSFSTLDLPFFYSLFLFSFAAKWIPRIQL